MPSVDEQLAEIAATEERLKILARGEQLPAEAYVPTQAEVEHSTELARNVKPPFEAIRISRETGAITGTITRRNTPMQSLVPKLHVPAGTSRRVRPTQRRREQRPRRATRSTASRGDPHLPAGDDDELARLRANARAARMVHISELLEELLAELRRWPA
jgi:hypothetical protein